MKINGYYTNYDGLLCVGGETDALIGDSLVLAIDDTDYEFELTSDNSKQVDDNKIIFDLPIIPVGSTDPINIQSSISGTSITSDSYDIEPQLAPSSISIDSVVKQTDRKLSISGTSNVDDGTSVTVTISTPTPITLTATVNDGEWSVSTTSEVIVGDYILTATVTSVSGIVSSSSKKLRVVLNPEYVRFISHNIITKELKPTIYGTVGISKTNGRGYDTKQISQSVYVEIIKQDGSVLETFDAVVDTNGVFSITPTNDLENGEVYVVNARSTSKIFTSYEYEIIDSLESLLITIDTTIEDYNSVYQSTIFTVGIDFGVESELVYQDAMPPSTNDPLNRQKGWYYINDYEFGAQTNDKKINWALSDQFVLPYTLGEIKSVYVLITLDSISDIPYWAVYTQKEGTTGNAGSWYRSRMTYANFDGVAPTETGQYILHINDEPSVYSEIPKVKMIKEGVSTTIGPQLSTEKILLMALNTSSSEAAGNYEFFVEEMGFETTDGEIFKLKLR